jgi:hypothetical protein
MVAARRAVAKRLPSDIKLAPQSWSVTVTPSSLMKTDSKASVDTAIFDADKVDADFAVFSENRGRLSFLVKGLKPGSAYLICHNFFFQPPGLVMPGGLVTVTIEADDATVTVQADPSNLSLLDFNAVLLASGSAANVIVTTDWPFTWFWRETLFGTVQG